MIPNATNGKSKALSQDSNRPGTQTAKRADSTRSAGRRVGTALSDAALSDTALPDTAHSGIQRPVAAHLVEASKVYESGTTKVRAIDGINLEFATGQFTAIMGPSGSGKSTTMHCLAGLDQLTEGHAYIGDVDLGSLSSKELTLLRRSQLGFIFQAFNLIPSLSAEENITLPLALSGKSADSAIFDDVINVLGLRGRMSHRPSELSGGQQQRVAVARALVNEPAIVFADEPTGNLDSRTGTEILGFLRTAVDEREQTLVMVTHDPVAAAWADRVVFLVDGGVHEEIHNPDTDSILAVTRNLGR